MQGDCVIYGVQGAVTDDAVGDERTTRRAALLRSVHIDILLKEIVNIRKRGGIKEEKRFLF